MQNKMSRETTRKPTAKDKSLPDRPSTDQQCVSDQHTRHSIYDQFTRTKTGERGLGQLATGSSSQQMSRVESPRGPITRHPDEDSDSDSDTEGDISKPAVLSSAMHSDNFNDEENDPETIREQLTKKLDEMTAELASLQHSTDPFRVGDERIARSRDELYHDIRNWSRNFRILPKKYSIGNFVNMRGSQGDCPFQVLTPSYDKYLDSETGLSLLVQSYVWKTLLDEVFGHFIWMGASCRRASVGPARTCPIYKSFERLCDVSRTGESCDEILESFLM